MSGSRDDDNDGPNLSELGETLELLGALATTAATASEVIGSMITAEAAAVARPVLIIYMVTAVFGAIEYARHGKPEQSFKGIEGQQRFEALVAKDAITVDAGGAPSWRFNEQQGNASIMTSDVIEKWAFMTTYSGGRALFGSIVGRFDDTIVNANVRVIKEHTEGDSIWTRNGMRAYLAKLSENIIGKEDTFVERVSNTPVIALVAIGLIFTIGTRAMSRYTIRGPGNGMGLNGASPMVTGILAGFADVFRNYELFNTLVPLAVAIKAIGPVAMGITRFGVSAAFARATQNRVAAVLNPSALVTLGAQWILGALPTTGMTMGYAAQVRLNLMSQLLLAGGGMALWQSSSPESSMRRLANFSSMVLAVRVVAWLAWYGFTTFQTMTSETYRVTFNDTGDHVIKRLEIGEQVYHNVPIQKPDPRA